MFMHKNLKDGVSTDLWMLKRFLKVGSKSDATVIVNGKQARK